MDIFCRATARMVSPARQTSTSFMQTCAVIVTYDDRFNVLNSVISALIRQNIGKIIVVDNNSCENSKQHLHQLERGLNGLMSIVSLEQNTGSAGGFKAGLMQARKISDCDFIWLLDDDNRPEPNAMAALQAHWNANVQPNGAASTCLVSFRESRPEYRDYALGNETIFNSIIEDRNAFLGLNILRPIRMVRHLNLLLSKKKTALPRNDVPDIGHLPFAPYGGMFFHKALLNTIGYPDDRLYLYCDDLEYSYRIVHEGGDILLVYDSLITDLDEENDAKANDSFQRRDLMHLYYKTRNLTYFRRQLIDRSYIYAVNKTLFWPIISVGGIVLAALWKRRRAEIRVYLTAVSDGLRGKLGKKDSIL